MYHRPRLKSHAQPLRRGPGSLQLGLSPDTGVVLDGLSDAEIVITEGLDGSRDLPTLYARAAAAGVEPDRVSALISALIEHRLLIDTTTDRAWLSPLAGTRHQPARPDATAMAIAAAYHLTSDGLDCISARATQHVLISGEGDLPCALADLLRVGGIGPHRRCRGRGAEIALRFPVLQREKTKSAQCPSLNSVPTTCLHKH